MGIFGDKSNFDPADLNVLDLEEGFLFEMKGKSYEVFKEFYYDWGDEDYTKEVGITDGENKLFLYMEDDDELELVISKKIPIRSIQEDLPDIIKNDGEPPKKIEYQGESYLLDESNSAYCLEGPFDADSDDWERFDSWDYKNKDGNKVLSVERWGDYEFEAAEGYYIKESDIQDIMPPSDYAERLKEREDSDNAFGISPWKALKTGCGCIAAFFLVFMLITGVMVWFNSEDADYKSPVDLMIKDMHDKPNFSIILHDMDEEGLIFKTYKHQYKVVIESEPAAEVDENAAPSTDNSEPEAKNVTSNITDWKEVSRIDFNKNEANMGMELAHKKDGKVKKQVSPPGYSHYVGNRRYGYWKNDVWSYYGRYRFMSDMFYMSSYPIRRSYYNDYYGNYYSTGRAYYGGRDSYGRSRYGTYGRYNSGRSTRYSRSSRYRSGSRSYSSGRSSRSGSRYSGGSSHRSRGGGFGK